MTMGKTPLRIRARPVALFCLLSAFCSVTLAKITLMRLRGSDHRERGDVPGWVMVTIMTALLVVALLAVAGPALTKMFNDAISKVGN